MKRNLWIILALFTLLPACGGAGGGAADSAESSGIITTLPSDADQFTPGTNPSFPGNEIDAFYWKDAPRNLYFVQFLFGPGYRPENRCSLEEGGFWQTTSGQSLATVNGFAVFYDLSQLIVDPTTDFIFVCHGDRPITPLMPSGQWERRPFEDITVTPVLVGGEVVLHVDNPLGVSLDEGMLVRYFDATADQDGNLLYPMAAGEIALHITPVQYTAWVNQTTHPVLVRYTHFMDTISTSYQITFKPLTSTTVNLPDNSI